MKGGSLMSRDRTNQNKYTAKNNSLDQSFRPLITAGVVLGLGQAGFFDGIVFHQLLQWHHMFSSVETDMTVIGMEINTLGDGLFHLFNWVMTLLGIGLLWRATQTQRHVGAGRVFVGALLSGAGLFNLTEGFIDHQLLGIHHLKSGIHQGLWDVAFLASGVLLIAVGVNLIQAVRLKDVKEIV
jgi:uncharacterized membrane protein